MQEMIQKYLNELEAEDRAENTLINYKLHLDKYISWCKQLEIDYLSVTPKQAKEFRTALYSAKLSNKTINVIVGTVRNFYEYLMQEEMIQGNPFLKSLHIREKASQPKPLTKEEQYILNDVLESKEKHIRLAFRTMLCTGIRVGEASRLTPENVKYQDERVILYINNSKSGKSRIVPVTNSDVAIELLEYSRTVPAGERLFRVSKRTLQGHAEHIKEKTGISFNAHKTRHTFATNQLEAGTRIDIIQRIMGHTNISTTMLYADTLDKDIINIAKPIKKGDL